MGFQHGLSGLNAASKNLDVIGHNIANANTVGFKASRADFAEAVANAAGQGHGMGVNVAAINQQFHGGDISGTGNALHVAINGNGFFAVRQSDGSAAYTRAGNFQLDKNGYLRTAQNDQVLGFMVNPATGRIEAGGAPVPLLFPGGKLLDPTATSEIRVAANLDARALPAEGDPKATPPVPPTERATCGVPITVYDSQGVATTVSLYFEKDTAANTWKVYDGLDDPDATPPVKANLLTTLVFDEFGKLKDGGLVEGVKIASNNPNAPEPGFINGDAGVTLDFSAVTQLGSAFAVDSRETRQNGNAAGTLTGVHFEKDGSIVAEYSNGMQRREGQLALAGFANMQGLQNVGDNKWVETGASGQAAFGTAGAGVFGALYTESLEDSNVDLTAELVSMMTAQRAYQANAQTIKTQDQVFSTLMNLR